MSRTSELTGRRLAAPWLVLLASLLTLACSSSESPELGPSAGTGVFGAPCQRTEDCASRLCVRKDDSTGVCTQTCASDLGCPASANWGCVSAEGLTPQICACVPDAGAEICGDGIDNECNGLVDDCMLCDGVPIPKDDPDHCGACDVSCRSDQTCSLGKCICPPDSPFECAGKCARFDSDPQNCGACGTVCNPGQACVNGICSCTSALTPDYCDGIGCVDLDSDVANCGTCGTECPNVQSCIGGKCTCPVTGQEYCNGFCISMNANQDNCGSCGNKCPSGGSCSNGLCSCPLNAQDICADKCVDMAIDELNCGSCGNACLPTQQCVGGSCTCVGGTLCNGTCVNTGTDTANCGGCGQTCALAHVCNSGVCACPAYAPTDCGGLCINTQSSTNHCGGCGQACGSGQYCSLGSCKCSVSSQTICASGCVDTKTDSQNCGGCDKACPAAQTCVNSTCTCGSGKTYCPATQTCVTTSTDPANCGSCGHQCENGQICSSSTCKCQTYTETWCASTGTCTSIYSNPSHCGACDKTCPAGTHCSGYSCVCDVAGQTLCGTECANLQTDPLHCSSCSKACVGNQICNGGKCQCPTPVVGAAVRLTTTVSKTWNPAAAWSGTKVGVVYVEEAGGLYFALLNADGTRAKSPDVAVGAGSLYEPDITWTGSEFGVTWRTNSAIWFRRLDANGTPKAAAVDISAATTGTKLPIAAPRITWSSVYAGYALVSAQYSSVSFQRIGTDGSAPEAVNVTTTNSVYHRPAVALSPSGEWGIAVIASSSPTLVFYNSDGSKTKAPVALSSSGYYSLLPSLAHDGTTWVTTWAQNSQGIMVNRGEVGNSPALAASLGTAYSYTGTTKTLLRSGGVYDLVELHGNMIFLRRSTLSQSGPTSVTPLASDVSILATPNGTSMDAVSTGSNSVLALWSDTRWGAEELYAAPVDLQNCP
ncbi:MAG: hypothetical protein R3B13_21910 [Polyangiaceae bacterium]